MKHIFLVFINIKQTRKKLEYLYNIININYKLQNINASYSILVVLYYNIIILFID